MCGYLLWPQRKTPDGWRHLGSISFALKKEGDISRALQVAGERISADKILTGLSWGHYRVVETNCRHDCALLDLGSGDVIKTDFDDYGIYPGRALDEGAYQREEEEISRRKEFLSGFSSGALARRSRDKPLLKEKTC